MPRSSFVLAAALLAACGDVAPAEVTEAQNEVSSSVINGVAATDEQVAKQGAMFANGSFRCGGTYIGEGNGSHWVLTAAHCVEGLNEVSMGFGQRNRGDYNSSNLSVSESIVIHRRYTDLDYDIAVVSFAERPLNAQVVELVDRGENTPDGSATDVVGFGITREFGLFCAVFGVGCPSSAQMLQTGQVTTIGRSECAALAPGNVTNRMICTLDDDSTVQGSCNGDSGGPLYREDGKQIGLVSWGVLGCDVDSPSVYASVANLRRWITRNTGI